MTEPLAPVVRSVVVPCDPAEAFALFAEEIDRWWPTATHSVALADAASVSIEPHVGGAVVERLRSGETCVWGHVTAWNPPAELAMTWHPGYGPDRATDVRVRFRAHADGTLVELVHSGWERLADGATVRTNYLAGWVVVLTPYADLAGAGPGGVR